MYDTIISVAELGSHLDDSDWLIFDCRFVAGHPELGRQKYLEGHIPGARHVDLDQDASSAVTQTSGRHPLPDPQQLRDKLRNWGVCQDSQIVVYDDAACSIAGRFWWVLRWLGHTKVAVLDGGFSQWVLSGHTLQSGEPPPPPPGDFDYACNDELWISTEQVEKSLGQADSVVIDARAPARYTGEKEGVDGEGGHIPTSVNYPLQDNLDEQGKFLPPEQLRSRFENLSGRTCIHSCGSGVTACHNIIAMKIAGLDEDIKLYVGSWSEWIRSPERKRVQGKEPGSP